MVSSCCVCVSASRVHSGQTKVPPTAGFPSSLSPVAGRHRSRVNELEAVGLADEGAVTMGGGSHGCADSAAVRLSWRQKRPMTLIVPVCLGFEGRSLVLLPESDLLQLTQLQTHWEVPTSNPSAPATNGSRDCTCRTNCALPLLISGSSRRSLSAHARRLQHTSPSGSGKATAQERLSR
jgi:hypothetical protein